MYSKSLLFPLKKGNEKGMLCRRDDKKWLGRRRVYIYIYIYIYIYCWLLEYLYRWKLKKFFCNKRKLLLEAWKKNSFSFQVIILNLFFIKEKNNWTKFFRRSSKLGSDFREYLKGFLDLLGNLWLLYQVNLLIWEFQWLYYPINYFPSRRMIIIIRKKRP